MSVASHVPPVALVPSMQSGLQPLEPPSGQALLARSERGVCAFEVIDSSSRKVAHRVLVDGANIEAAERTASSASVHGHE
mmetsp:Transcript_8412/g.19821  ORF Transcript_8412/g.19821 Transcript_8412/m.19821 type:complete len:80 (+) Transcript_8412:404-643(+)